MFEKPSFNDWKDALIFLDFFYVKMKIWNNKIRFKGIK